jgi:nucleoside-diphosphate-sugar epimerase
MIITGATGFLGRQLVRQLRKEYRIVALGRRDPVEAGAPVGPGIEWFRVDIADFESLRQVFERIRELGGARLLLHMAAYYDFTGEDNPEYQRTNVIGTENLIKLAEPMKLRRFIFASSVAACPFPESGCVVTEATPPIAPVPYARSKQIGEEMMLRYRDAVPSCIVRPAAIFSEWCEYEPLNAFLRTWCSRRWHARVIGGRGISGIPYLHVRDLLSFFLRVVEKCDEFEPAEVLMASPDGATSHIDLFRVATHSWFGSAREPLNLAPRLAAGGIRLREVLGRLTGFMPFERSWMVEYIDRQLTVDAARTRRRIDWAPNPDLDVIASLDDMVRNLRADRREWRRRNRRRGGRRRQR